MAGSFELHDPNFKVSCGLLDQPHALRLSQSSIRVLSG